MDKKMWRIRIGDVLTKESYSADEAFEAAITLKRYFQGHDVVMVFEGAYAVPELTGTSMYS